MTLSENMCMPKTATYAELGARLKTAREALKLGPANAVAARLGVTPTTYSNYETGVSRMPVDVMAKLIAQTGLTSDYLYFGIASGLPVRIATILLPPPSPAARDAG